VDFWLRQHIVELVFFKENGSGGGVGLILGEKTTMRKKLGGGEKKP
jgi:hypothetical protein